jgi:hypothetical protein
MLDLNLNLDLRRLHMVEPSRKRPLGSSEAVFLGSSGLSFEAERKIQVEVKVEGQIV